MKHNLALFCDVSNLYYCINKKFPNRKLDYEKYLKFNEDENILWRAIAYGLQLNKEANSFINCLKHFGYEPKYKKPRKYTDPETEQIKLKRISWNVGIALDVVRYHEKLDIVVLGSSDPELVDLIVWVKDQGIKCKVVSCGISKELKDVADEWIEITEEFLE